MEKRKNEKTASIVASLAVVAASMFAYDLESVAICRNCGIYARLLYPFFHANMLHASLNAWCLLGIVFMYDVSSSRLLMSYIAAVSVPSFLLNDMPTVGLSGSVFFLFASISFEVQRKVYYQSWMLLYLVSGFLLPNTNGLIHVYCYVLGVFYALLNKPVEI